MTRNWFQSGLIRMQIKHVQWRDGLAYYRRRIPDDLRKQHSGKSHLFFSLKTRDFKEAAKKALEQTKHLDREWMLLRATDGTDLETRAKAMAILRKYDLEPGQASEYAKHDLEPDAFVTELLVHSQDEDGNSSGIIKNRLPEDLRLAAELFYADPMEVRELTVPSFTNVIEKHLYFYPKRAEDSQFDRSVNRFLKINGDMPINQYRREHGNAFVRDLIESGVKSATVKRYLNQLRPIFNTAITELEIPMANPLQTMKIPETGEDQDQSRKPFTLAQMQTIQERCRQVDDQRRWVLSIISDTGARLSEVAGLLRSEVVVGVDIPHIIIQPNKLRGLKTKTSHRIVPLVGEALWAAKQALKCGEGEYLFPEIVKGGKYNNNSTSAALNKWLTDQKLRGPEQPVHSFRHSLRDRLRNSNCPPDVADRIGGWKRQGVGEGYGVGHDLAVMHKFMLAMIDSENG